MYSCFCANPPSLILRLFCTLYKHCVILYSVAQILLYTEAQTTGKQSVEMCILLLVQYRQGACGGSKRDCFKFFVRKSHLMDHLSHQKAFNNNNFKVKKKKVCLIFPKKQHRGNDHCKGQELRLKGGIQGNMKEVKICMCCLIALFLVENGNSRAQWQSVHIFRHSYNML